jgi:hypothetical protein
MIRAAKICPHRERGGSRQEGKPLSAMRAAEARTRRRLNTIKSFASSILASLREHERYERIEGD